MDRLYKMLYGAFLKELDNLTVGRGFDDKNLDYMNDLIHTIMFLEDPKTKSVEGISVLNKYVLFD